HSAKPARYDACEGSIRAGSGDSLAERGSSRIQIALESHLDDVVCLPQPILRLDATGPRRLLRQRLTMLEGVAACGAGRRARLPVAVPVEAVRLDAMRESARDKGTKRASYGMGSGIHWKRGDEKGAAAMRLRVGKRAGEKHVGPDATEEMRWLGTEYKSLDQPGVGDWEHSRSVLLGIRRRKASGDWSRRGGDTFLRETPI